MVSACLVDTTRTCGTETKMQPIREAYPSRDKNGQWWYADQKVKMIVMPEEEKQTYLNKMKNLSNKEK